MIRFFTDLSSLLPSRKIIGSVVNFFYARAMTGKRGLTMQHMATFLKTMSEEQLARRLAPDFGNLPKMERVSAKVSRERARQRWTALPDFAPQAEILLEKASDFEAYQGNIENFIGELRMPIGLAGPLRVNALAAKGSVLYPFSLECVIRHRWPQRRAAVISHRGRHCLIVEKYESMNPAEWQEFATDHHLDDLHWIEKIPLDRRHNAKVDYTALRAWIESTNRD